MPASLSLADVGLTVARPLAGATRLSASEGSSGIAFEFIVDATARRNVLQRRATAAVQTSPGYNGMAHVRNAGIAVSR